ncbi:MAG: hypothetical protein K9N34_02670 [Candidatus Marinimicrobia bacterium]|nr:hypothetical protein [Candidatus Neomarinimicrobiota bacterium]MCF7839543.1 hypothetical protein [Candidatus Neomarinimicrobiota bacterium]MCF7901912.1 hypothetical protein [Candidatus Neomarinimicrobiota bacterium]
MSKFITFLILFYLIYRGSRWLLSKIKIQSDEKSKVGGKRQAQRKLNIDKRDIEDADYKDIHSD